MFFQFLSYYEEYHLDILFPKLDTIRLVGGRSKYEGRVEILQNGAWGTVCDDQWDMHDAAVVCRELGYATTLEATSQASFGQGTGAILLDDLRCSGREIRLVDCPHNGLGQHNCQHLEDAGVVCQDVSKYDDSNDNIPDLSTTSKEFIPRSSKRLLG